MNLDSSLSTSADICARNRTVRLLSASMLLSAASVSAQTQSLWLNPIDGDWDDTANWSSALYPNNGQPAASDAYDVLIDAFGSPYQVNLDFSVSPIEINTLTLDSPDATLYVTGNLNLSATNGLNLNNGLLQVAQGKITNTIRYRVPMERSNSWIGSARAR